METGGSGTEQGRFDFVREGRGRGEKKLEWKNGVEENKQIIARKLMSTLGPSQLFKPNDGDRKKEETEGSGDE